MKNKTIIINGGKTLSGIVEIVPNKNAILPAIAASILTDDTMFYRNVPMSPDVKKMCSALESMGATIYFEDQNLQICCKDLSTWEVPDEHISGIQAGYLFAGPLLSRFGKAKIPQTSGCRLGYRGHEDHAEYFRKIGISFTLSSDSILFFKDKNFKKQNQALYNSAFVTPTENILMFLAGEKDSQINLSGIAQEPHVKQLIQLLKKMGATILGQGSDIEIIGGKKMNGAIFEAESDHVDYFGFAITAAITKSDLLLKVSDSVGINHLSEFLTQTGIILEKVKDGIMVFGSRSQFNPMETFPRADEWTYKMNPGPWPMFPVDCLPSFIAWSTMNKNENTSTRSNNWLYTDGLKYISAMKEMGAKIGLYDDQRVVTIGNDRQPYSRNLEITSPDVIEGARAIINCALSGGIHTIKNAQYILRRNPKFFDILKELGADIEIV